jgi:Vitamin K-dependent gamma-carboxylase
MQLRKLRCKLRHFLFPWETDRWLTLLRIGLALQILLYCLSLRGDWFQLFASEGRGLISRDLTEAIVSAETVLTPRLGWIIAAGNYLGFDQYPILWFVWWSLICGALCLLAGIFCRSAAVLVWFLHLCTTNSVALFSYGVDNFTSIGLFYLMVAPLPDRWSLDTRIRPSTPKANRVQGFHRRILQMHMCLVYFFGGIAKSVGVGWWNGTSLWRALTRPPFNVISPDLLIVGKNVLPVLGIMVCVAETGYPFFIWPRKSRPVWFALIVGMHATIGIAMGMYLFALIMVVLNTAAFGPGLIGAKKPTRIGQAAGSELAV